MIYQTFNNSFKLPLKFIANISKIIAEKIRKLRQNRRDVNENFQKT